MSGTDETSQVTSNASSRLLRSGIRPGDLGGDHQDRERLIDRLVDAAVLEATVEGTLRVTGTAASDLEATATRLAVDGVPATTEVVQRLLADDPAHAHQLLDDWASPVRLAAAGVVADRVELTGGALIAAAELTTRLSLAGLLGSVVVTTGSGFAEEAEARIDPGQLLALLLFCGVLVEADDGDLELSDAFVGHRDRQRDVARGWKAARRRELLGELLLLQDAELSDAFRLAGFPDSVSELATLHRFTALTSLGLWTAWQSLTAFDRPFEKVDSTSIDDWLTGDVIVMITSPSSSPAQQLEAVLAEAVRGQQRSVAVVDADTERALCERFDVDRPPMVLLLRDGEELDRTRWSVAALALRTFIDDTFGTGSATDRSYLPLAPS